MSAISNTSTTMPTATADGGGGASKTRLPGATISSVGGQTTLPAASASDFTGDTNPLDVPDATYRSLSVAHVAVFRAIGTPEDLLAQIAAEQPDAAVLDAYIQDEIMRNPEAWDQRTGQQPGTTRAGLTQLFPGQPLGGTPTRGGVAPAAMFTPTTDGGSMSGIAKLALGTAVVGAGIGGVVLGKRHIARSIESGIQALDATRVQQLGMHAPGGAPGGVAGIVSGGGGDAASAALQVAGGGGTRLQDVYAANMAQLALQNGDADAMRNAVLLDMIGRGRMDPLDQATTMHSVTNGLGLGDPRLSRLLSTADNHGADQNAVLDAAVKLSLIDKLDGRAAASLLGAGTRDAAGGAGEAAADAGSLDDVVARLAVARLLQPGG